MSCSRTQHSVSSKCQTSVPGHVAQSVTCLATDASLTADPGVASSILAWSHTFMEIDYEIIPTVILLPSSESFKKETQQNQTSDPSISSLLLYHWATAFLGLTLFFLAGVFSGKENNEHCIQRLERAIWSWSVICRVWHIGGHLECN